MSQRFKKSLAPDLELQEKLRELVSAYRTQGALAQRLRPMTQQMISSWLRSENPKEPDSKSLVALGNAAAEHHLVSEELANWFWARAGIDIKAVQKMVNSQLRAARSPWKQGEAIHIKLLDETSIAAERRESVRSVSLPADYLPTSKNLICLEFKERYPSRGCRGDIFVIDESGNSPAVGDESFVAVYLSPYPVELFQRSLPSWALEAPAARSLNLAGSCLRLGEPTGGKDKAARSRNAKRAPGEHEAPGCAFGWISLQFASGQWDAAKRDPREPWRVLLELEPRSGLSIELTPWISGEAAPIDRPVALSGYLLGNVTILGTVIGWIRSQGSSKKALINRSAKGSDQS